MEKFSTDVYCETLYSVNTTKYMYALQGITVEREYLYWTNEHSFETLNTPVSKAFAEPFIKKVPLQTFTLNITSGAKNLAANSAFLFVETIGGNDGNRLIALNKHGYTAFYYDLNLSLSSNTSALKSYRDELLFIVEPDEISFLDVTDLELNPMDAKKPVTPMKKQRLILNKMPSGKGASGITVISKYQTEIMSQFKDINELQ